MGKRNFSIGKYLCLGWLAIYLLISIFKFIQINYKINVKYGIAAKKFMVIGYTNESVVIDNILLFLNKTIFPHFNPLYEYAVPNKMSSTIKLRAPFMDKSFNITMRGGEIVKDTFYETITTDPKFQHLYSEWVKKQAGIEDEEVELEFKEEMKGARMVGEPVYIDFSKITSLDNLDEQICENVHNLHVYSIDKKILDKNHKDDWFSIAKETKNEFLSKVNSKIPSLLWDNKIVVKLYYYDVDLIYNKYDRMNLNKDETNFYYVQFDLKNGITKYLSNYYDMTGAIIETWLKDIKDE